MPRIIPPEMFKGPGFLEGFKAAIIHYMKLLAFGKSKKAALRVSFGEAYAEHINWRSYVDHLECTAFFINEFPKVLKANQTYKVWNEHSAIRSLVALADDSEARDNVRLAAITQLNVLCGITLTDVNGNTVVRRTLEDFYAEQNENRHKRHPEPGTPEAEALVKSLRNGNAEDDDPALTVH